MLGRLFVSERQRKPWASQARSRRFSAGCWEVLIAGGELPLWKGLSSVNTVAVSGVRLKKPSSSVGSSLTAGVVRRLRRVDLELLGIGTSVGVRSRRYLGAGRSRLPLARALGGGAGAGFWPPGSSESRFDLVAAFLGERDLVERGGIRSWSSKSMLAVLWESGVNDAFAGSFARARAARYFSGLRHHLIVEDLNELALLRIGGVVHIMRDEDGSEPWHSQRRRVEAALKVIDTLSVGHCGFVIEAGERDREGRHELLR